MSSMLKQQREFMEACGQKPWPQNFALYLNLIDEEYKELLEAVNLEDRIDMATATVDALIDILYVTAGALNCLSPNPDEFWEEVHRSNMAKIDPVTGTVLRRADGKVQKPEGWKPPNLRPIVLRHAEAIGKQILEAQGNGLGQP